MDAIEKIILQMDETAQAERTSYEQTERAKIDQEFEQKRTQVENDYQKQLKKQTELLDKKYRQLKNRQQVEIRQETLNEKQRFLHHLFAESTKKMESWDEKEFQSFTEQALEKLDLSGEIQLIAGEKSEAYFTENWLEKLNQKLSFRLVKSSQIIPKQAGFLLDDQGVQYNFIFSHLIQDLQGTMGYEIAQQLFE
ncbi:MULTISPECIES: hypothetical protein [unclassified Enterococcus]|jgi:V/A-type H+-transporting ATPase subunit E|uniref:hypothetical protein n=1 Tax=unclassified Enterococcus TaxID=2608891 RepID=UPI0003541370|nr:putative V-type sodium ATPase, E subunit [Enterococcus faecalis 13-SD-W-01]